MAKTLREDVSVKPLDTKEPWKKPKLVWSEINEGAKAPRRNEHRFKPKGPGS
jgi:hypothetical protein